MVNNVNQLQYKLLKDLDNDHIQNIPFKFFEKYNTLDFTKDY